MPPRLLARGGAKESPSPKAPVRSKRILRALAGSGAQAIGSCSFACTLGMAHAQLPQDYVGWMFVQIP